MTLRDEILAFIDRGQPEPARLQGLACALIRQQVREIEALARWYLHRGVSVDQLSRLEDIVPLPTRAFKLSAVHARSAGPNLHVFRSSGTSGHRPSESHYSADDLELMELAVVRNASEMLFPDRVLTRILVLAPPPSLAPHMIMAWGMERLIRVFGAPGSRFLVDANGMNPADVLRALEQSVRDEVPVTLIGASFGFVHLLDWMRASGRSVSLMDGSRTMDAGGYKGRSRTVTRGWLEDEVASRLGVEARYAVNLLGMTELSSQFYDNVLHEGSVERRRKVNAPWTATWALDPCTMRPCLPGEPGLLCHLDLANIERPACILSEDMGLQFGDGWTVLGRAPGLDARGCSLSIEALCQ